VTLRGGIRVRLAVGVLVVVCGALLAAYLIVVPSLEKRLVDAKLSELQRNAVTLAAGYSTRDLSDPLSLDNFAKGAAFAFDARVSIFEVIGPPVGVSSLADSADVGIAAMGRDAIALATATTGHGNRGRVRRSGREYAEVAAPLTGGRVLLLSASLGDQLSTVHLVQRRLLYASLAAFLIALMLGSAAAASHARRIRRLERAAERIAEGAFDEPVVDTGDDELGELARTFDRMRIQLAQLDSARRAFVAHASHELRTPLFALGGFLELLEDEDVDEETRRSFLGTMHEQVQRLTKLTTDLLDLSRIDAGGMRVENEDVDLADVARTVVDELRGLAEGREQQLELDAADVWAAGDEERILQIGRALVGNGLLHTPAGSRVVVRSAAGDGVSRLEVEDDGPGIPEGELRRIFERFYRVEEGRASGSGLGLAIARELAERMGGSVRVSSRPGRTVFTLELLAAEADRESAPETEQGTH
jgi:two-component system, OmpR family, sensor kinase